MRFGVVVFPGSNCDHDAWFAVSHNLGQQADYIWHDSHTLGNVDAVILPGGFAYGDYLRCGAIAKFSPVMQAVKRFAAEGGLVLGICNGFQILVESGLLPGALIRNRGLKFICRPVGLSVGTSDTPFTSQAQKGDLLTFSIAHGEAATSPTTARSTNWRPKTGWCSATRITRTGLCGTSPASSTANAT